MRLINHLRALTGPEKSTLSILTLFKLSIFIIIILLLSSEHLHLPILTLKSFEVKNNNTDHLNAAASTNHYELVKYDIYPFALCGHGPRVSMKNGTGAAEGRICVRIEPLTFRLPNITASESHPDDKNSTTSITTTQWQIQHLYKSIATSVIGLYIVVLIIVLPAAVILPVYWHFGYTGLVVTECGSRRRNRKWVFVSDAFIVDAVFAVCDGLGAVEEEVH
ncbi:hypothetical protein ACMFMF_006093 [Clarireedia jacksonii]